tara:strand:+ start:478 stop:696 length:219 start_codon:yes stop_codon:yes gene_type:complete
LKEIKVAQGVSGEVVSKGSINRHIPYLIVGYCNLLELLSELHNALRTGKLLMEIRSFCSQREGNVHDIFNYD